MKKFLLVEDAHDLIEFLQELFKESLMEERHHSFSLDVAMSKEDALTFLQKNSYDYVILDIILPDSNDNSLAEYIISTQPQAVVSIFSGSDFDPNIFYKIGIKHCYKKPVDTRKVIDVGLKTLE